MLRIISLENYLHLKKKNFVNNVNVNYNSQNMNEVTSTGARKSSISKFDQYDPFMNKNIQININPNNPQPHPTLANYPSKISTFRNKYDIGNESNELGAQQYFINSNFQKRSKAYSIHEKGNYQNKMNVPLNKDYDVFAESKIEHSYSMKDITRIFINMNLMKKFDFPTEFKTKYISEIMNKKNQDLT